MVQLSSKYTHIKKVEEDISFIVVDLFCGAGGVTYGIEQAKNLKGEKLCKVIAAVNHDPLAIQSHETNHSDVLHYIEDVLLVNVKELASYVQRMKEKYPNAKLILWASLECTFFSIANNGYLDNSSRTLANGLIRYIKTLQPDFVYIENVPQFLTWGPIDLKSGRPIKKLKGRDYFKWTNRIQNIGYNYGFRLLNCADYGDATTRVRYFGIFAKKGLPIMFPKQTHVENLPENLGLFSSETSLKKWVPIKAVLNFDVVGESIFTRKKYKIRSEKTWARIYEGLVEHVGNGDDSWILKYLSNNPRTGINKGVSVNKPSHTLSTQARHQLVQPVFISKYYTGEGQHFNLESPAHTITKIDHHSIVSCEFVQKYFGTGKNILSINQPCSTLTKKDRIGVVQLKKNFIDLQYSNGSTSRAIELPAATLTKIPKLNLVTVNKGFMLNPQYFGNDRSIEKPCFTIIRRQDKAPLYFVNVIEGDSDGAIVIYPDDSEIKVKVKIFMAFYGITDIMMRMLQVVEMKRITGLPDDYYLAGKKKEQKAFIGNAVPTKTVTALMEAYNPILEKLKTVSSC